MSTTPPEPKIERETKLQPSPDFELSGLADAIEGSTLVVLPPLDLVATYLDTPPLTLARSGITLRHRKGDGADRWTLKLPTGSDANTLVRREIEIEGSESRRPRELTTALTVHLRGRRLVPVAVISTVRHRVVIHDESGVALVEVAHDLVSATQRRHPLGSWEEIEVEALDPVLGPAALAQTVKALRAIGCRRARAEPKLVRALGAPAASPPELVIPRLPRHPRPHQALQHALTRSVLQITDHDPRVRLGGDPEDLHQFRVAVRRLRSDVRTFRRFLPAEQVERLAAELRWVADETNELRDLDVLRGWLTASIGALPIDDAPAADTLVDRCDEQRDQRRTRLLRTLGSSRYLALIGDLVALAETPLEVTKQADSAARRRLQRQAKRRRDELRSRIHELRATGTDAALHQARIATKRWRAATEAIAPLTGRDAHRLAKSLAALQDVLGAAHDAAVIEAWLRASADGTNSFVAGELALLARVEAARQQARWPDAWAQVRKRSRAV